MKVPRRPLLFVALLLMAGSPVSAGIIDEIEEVATKVGTLVNHITSVFSKGGFDAHEIYIAHQLGLVHQQLWKLEFDKRYLNEELRRPRPNWTNIHASALDLQQRLESASQGVRRFGAEIQKYDKSSSDIAGTLADTLSSKRASWLQEVLYAEQRKDVTALPALADRGDAAIANLHEATVGLAKLIRQLEE